MTQVQQARKGITTPEMIEAAKYDNVPVEMIKKGLDEGNIVIPKNINHTFEARAIGKNLKTKINSNIGTSEIRCSFQEELEKLEWSVKYGADSIMDLSTAGDLSLIRKKLITASDIMLGTVPIYAAATELIREEKEFSEMTSKSLFDEIELQAEQGVDFITVHCGITKATVKVLEESPRLLGVVSRGGSLLVDWIKTTGNENPLYEHYDKLMDICEKYDVTLSLGDGLRPGSLYDASDKAQMSELLVLGELVQKAQRRGVQVMVEGPGHVPLDQVKMNVQIQKRVCNNAPFYVLGPLVTDIAPGYDHITGAIGGAVAAAAGADFLCYVTPAEHLCLPDKEDVKQGIIASRIAAHSGDIAKGVKNAGEIDYKMSEARKQLNWNDMFKYALDPETAKKRKQDTQQDDQDYCSMCGNLCAIKIHNKSSKR